MAKQKEGLVDSIGELDEWGRVDPFHFKIELDESVEGLDKLIHQVTTMSSLIGLDESKE